jgi:acyl dehydratase
MLGECLSEWVQPVELGRVREFARAICDDQAAAELPVPPPTFPIVLAADFVERLVVDILKLDRKRTVHGEQEYEYLRPLRVGERIRCRARLKSDQTKQGRRGGTMRMLVTEIELSNADTGEIIGYERQTAIETGAGGEKNL